jgi:hypothetical protein
MLRLGIVSLPSPVNDAAYGGNTFWYRLAPTGPNASYAQNERDPFWRQCNLESLEENKMLDCRCALRQRR